MTIIGDDNDDIDRLHAENINLRIKLNAIIERCAQVAETFPIAVEWQTIYTAGIAVAIRTLKNEKAWVDPNLVYPGKDADFVFPEE